MSEAADDADDQDTRERPIPPLPVVIPEDREADPGPPDHTLIVTDLLSELQAAQRHANDLADRMNERVEAVERQVAELVRLGTRDRELVDKLHAENQRLRQGETAAIKAPLVRDVIRLCDLIDKLSRSAEDTGDLSLVRAQLVQALETHGVTELQPEVGAEFDGGRHEAVGATVTADEALDRCVAAVVTTGFVDADGRVLRAAGVEVYRHVPETEE